MKVYVQERNERKRNARTYHYQIDSFHSDRPTDRRRRRRRPEMTTAARDKANTGAVRRAKPARVPFISRGDIMTTKAVEQEAPAGRPTQVGVNRGRATDAGRPALLFPRGRAARGEPPGRAVSDHAGPSRRRRRGRGGGTSRRAAYRCLGGPPGARWSVSKPPSTRRPRTRTGYVRRLIERRITSGSVDPRRATRTRPRRERRHRPVFTRQVTLSSTCSFPLTSNTDGRPTSATVSFSTVTGYFRALNSPPMTTL